MVTNANPRDCCVAGSSISLTSVTGPALENKRRKSFSVTSAERFPTYNFEFMTFAKVTTRHRSTGEQGCFEESIPGIGREPTKLQKHTAAKRLERSICQYP